MKTVIRLVKAGLCIRLSAFERQVSNTAKHLDSIVISGITLSKFPAEERWEGQYVSLFLKGVYRQSR
jgi:hypothetical protein